VLNSQVQHKAFTAFGFYYFWRRLYKGYFWLE